MQGYTRRQLKEDKFAETTQGALEWAAGHRRPLVLTVGIIIVAILAAAGGYAWQSHHNEQANIAYSSALRTFMAPLAPAGAAPAGETMKTFPSIAERSKAAQKEFKAVADDYSSTKAGTMARYMQGIAAMQAGDTAAAEQLLKGTSEIRNKDVAALSKFALANMYRSSNRQSDAVRLFKELADHPTGTVPRTTALLQLAEMYETIDPQQAKNIYQQIQKEDPNTPAAQIATSKLAGGKQRGQ